MKQYSSMLRITRDFLKAVFLTKNRPSFLANRLCPVGGTKEEGETFLEACIREFHEEAGRATTPEDWQLYAILRGPDWEMHCFFSLADTLDDCVTMTEEPVQVLSIRDVLLAAATPAGQGNPDNAIADENAVSPDIAMLLGMVLAQKHRRSVAVIQF